MSKPLDLTLTSDLQGALQGLKPEAMAGAVARGLKTGAEYVVGQITKDRLTGKGPFPVAEHRLGVVSGRLRMALRAEGPIIQGNDVIMYIGDPVEYALTHEYGFIGQVSVPAHTRETKTGEVGVKAHTRKMNIAARAPISTGTEEGMPLILEAIGDEVMELMKGDTA